MKTMLLQLLTQHQLLHFKLGTIGISCLVQGLLLVG